MQVVSKILGTARSAMSIKNCEELNLELRLLCTVWLHSWFFEIQHDRYPILIVVSYQAIVSVSTIGYHVWQQWFLRYLSFLNNGSAWNLAHILCFEYVRI